MRGFVVKRRHARLDDQLCFALYAASRSVMGAYRAGLAELGLTYPQYLAMLAIWEADGSTVSALGRALALDSGTLSPILRRLRAAGYVRKERDSDDERIVRVYLTGDGAELERRVESVRVAVESSTGLTAAEFVDLRAALHTLRARVDRERAAVG